MSADVETDTANSFAMRHRARRAALLAAEIRRLAETYGYAGQEVAAAERMDDRLWARVALSIAERAGEPFKTPSEITRQICIGLLLMPDLEGVTK